MLYRFDGRQPVVGKDVYIGDSAKVIGDVFIGDNCYIGHGAILRADHGRIEIGAGTAVEEGVIIHTPPGGMCRIGDRVTFGHGAMVHGESVGDKVVVGMGAILSLWSKVGEGAIVAEGTVVKVRQVIPAKMVAAGNPAKIIRDVSPRDEEVWAFGKQLYVDLAQKCVDEPMEEILL